MLEAGNWRRYGVYFKVCVRMCAGNHDEDDDDGGAVCGVAGKGTCACTHTYTHHQKYNSVTRQLEELCNSTHTCTHSHGVIPSSHTHTHTHTHTHAQSHRHINKCTNWPLSTQIHQKYNSVMRQLEGLRDAAESAVEEADAARWKRECWLLGARKYQQLQTWKSVLGVLQGELGGMRSAAAAYAERQRALVLEQQQQQQH